MVRGDLAGLGLLAAALLAGCANLPDAARGQLAARNGQFEAAERDLRPLAERGYTDAQIALAQLYATRDTKPANAEAIKWFREALPKQPLADVPLARALVESGKPDQLKEADSLLRKADEQREDPVALALQVRLYTEHPELDKNKEIDSLVTRAEDAKNVQADAAIAAWLRETADENGHQERLVGICEQALERVPACYADMALHYRAKSDAQSLRKLTKGALDRYDGSPKLPPVQMLGLARALVDETVIKGTTEPQLATDIVHKVGDASLDARVQTGRLLTDFSFLDPEADPEKILLAASGEGSSAANYYLGRMYLDARRTARNPPRALEYLEKATPAVPQADYLLGRLYQIGYLGDADPQKAVTHLLAAARGGVPVADVALAQLFSEAHGVKPDLVNAYVFAKIAVLDDPSANSDLFVKIQDQMTPDQVAPAELRWDQEVKAREKLQAVPGDAS